jgi:two-component system phosphate regulon sensor histidine kinase PhoR
MKKKKLLWQIYPLYLLITLASLLAAGWYSSETMRQFFLEHTASDLEVRAQIISKQIHAFLSPLNQAAIDAIAKQTGISSSSTRITVMLPDGTVIGDSEEDPGKMDNHADRPEMVSVLTGKQGVSVRYSRTLQQKMMYVAVPIRDKDNLAAVLRTSVNISFVDEKLKSIRSKILLGGIVIALLAAGVSLMVSRRISLPIVEMKKGAENFARGELDYRLHVPDSEEIGELAQAMNRMAAQLDDRIKTVTQHRNEIEAILSSMSEGVIAVDKDARLISMNRAAARMFDRDISESLNRSILEVIRNTDLHRFVEKAISGKNPTKEDIVLHQNGERILHIHSTPLCFAKEGYVGILIVMNDVTRLRHLENIRRDFVANVSHEIKTPLTAIKGFVETLRQGAVNNPDEAGRFLEIIEKHTDRLTAIIDDLMNLSKIEQDRENKGIRLEPGKIKDVLLTAVQVCQTKAGEKNINIELNCDDEMTARINPPLLEQAAVNLLDNAIKYSDMKSRIRISAELRPKTVLPEDRSDVGTCPCACPGVSSSDTASDMTDREVVISFQDHGIGIGNPHLPRIFERFYRVDKARSRKLGGTGLGLAIVKHIVQSHGGYVTVESSPGKGSVFSIHL